MQIYDAVLGSKLKNISLSPRVKIRLFYARAVKYLVQPLKNRSFSRLPAFHCTVVNLLDLECTTPRVSGAKNSKKSVRKVKEKLGLEVSRMV